MQSDVRPVAVNLKEKRGQETFWKELNCSAVIDTDSNDGVYAEIIGWNISQAEDNILETELSISVEMLFSASARRKFASVSIETNLFKCWKKQNSHKISPARYVKHGILVWPTQTVGHTECNMSSINNQGVASIHKLLLNADAMNSFKTWEEATV